jgi:hypothetical protein
LSETGEDRPDERLGNRAGMRPEPTPPEISAAAWWSASTAPLNQDIGLRGGSRRRFECDNRAVFDAVAQAHEELL